MLKAAEQFRQLESHAVHMLLAGLPKNPVAQFRTHVFAVVLKNLGIS